MPPTIPVNRYLKHTNQQSKPRVPSYSPMLMYSPQAHAWRGPPGKPLARSLIFSVLLSGAGTWPQPTAPSAKRILGNFRGTAAASCDSEVLRELDASSLAIELRKAWCARNSHSWEQCCTWVNALRADLEDMKASSGEKLSSVPPFSQDPQPWCGLWRSFPGPWKELVTAVCKGVVESGTGEAPVPVEVQYPLCERGFGSMGALRSHAVRTHGKRDQLRRFVLSAECPACSRSFRPEHVHLTTILFEELSAAASERRISHGHGVRA